MRVYLFLFLFNSTPPLSLLSRYHLHITEPINATDLYLSLHQSDERMKFSERNIDIGITILKIIQKEKGEKEDNSNSLSGDDDDDNVGVTNSNDSDILYELICSTGHRTERQVQINSHLSVGNYLIIPSTTGCKVRRLYCLHYYLSISFLFCFLH